MNARIPAPDGIDLADLYRTHGTIVGVASALGIGVETAGRRLRDAGVELRQNVGPLALVPPANLAERYAAAGGIRALAVECGVSYGVARNWLVRAGVPRRRRGAPIRIDDTDAVDGRAEAPGAVVRRLRQSRGVSLERLAGAVGVQPSTIGSWERGRRAIPAVDYARILAHFGMETIVVSKEGAR